MKAQASQKPARRASPARDTLSALALALGVHLAGFGMLWLGSLSWAPKKPPQIAPSFTLVDASPYLEDQRREQLAEAQAEAAERRLEQARREEAERQQALQRQREQETQEEERQAALEAQRRRQLEREAEQARLAEERQQIERERREAEQARLRELEELRQRREQAQREREEQERRLAEIAERREQEEQRQREEAEAERLRLAREQAQASERRATLRDEYVATIAELVTRNWIRPPTTQPGVRCSVRVVQIPGGEIIDQAIASPCNADPATRRSIIAAVERAAVLPYRGYEDVFEREIIFEFVYNG
ncbi:MAG TPA: protein TolA [Wenzhouxiangellaceae bacterium]|nr:protein TolA [Wenzhouxiangellaceae bacterium]